MDGTIILNNISIYTLKLEDGFYYVGKTINFTNRLNQHLNGKGSEWTKKHKVIEVIEQIEFKLCSKADEDKWENFVTVKLMKEKGWFNVRGGFWCNCNDYETIMGLKHHNYFTEIELKDIQFSIQKYIIYALKLEQGKYFIGYTRNLKSAIKNHTKEKASHWTNRFRPIEIIEIWECESNLGKINIDLVDEKVFKYFELYSPENVRGGSYITGGCEDFHLKKVKANWVKPALTKKINNN